MRTQLHGSCYHQLMLMALSFKCRISFHSKFKTIPHNFPLSFNHNVALPRILHFPIIEASKRNSNSTIKKKSKNNKTKKKEDNIENKEEFESEEREVECNVRVISWRERHINAQILINADVHSVWDVLTDYERLAEFVPNLVFSKRISCPYSDRIWLMQRGVQRALYWHIEAQVVLDLRELPDSSQGKELHFSMVDGDFKQYEGKWALRPGNSEKATVLHYEVSVIPRYNFPAIFVEKVIRTDLPLNLRALASRVEAQATTKLKQIPSETTSNDSPLKTDHFEGTSGYSSKVTKQTSNELSQSSDVQTHWSTTGKVCSLDKHSMVDEVHLRRLDDLLEHGGVHRRVIATITIGASSREVWNILTAYERLPEFVPNLAISTVVSRQSNKVRLLQEGCKGLLYMVLHARVVLDLWELPKDEIVFEQVEGDFDSFCGKWKIEQLGGQHTLLKYVVETKMQRNCLLAEAIVEEVIYEDLPSNLCAIRDYIEKKVGTSNSNSSNIHQNQYEPKNFSETRKTQNEMRGLRKNVSRERRKVPGLHNNMEVLKSELFTFISQHGQEGFMPMRKQLRKHGRIDLEKAIHHMGGFRIVASLFNLSLSYKNRKPKGYWDSLENLKLEVSNFQCAWGMDPTYMPSRKTFERAGRFDLARAFEKWGGIYEVSRLLSLKVRHQRKPKAAEDDSLTSEKLLGSDQVPAESSSPAHSLKDKLDEWPIMPDELDPNWLN